MPVLVYTVIKESVFENVMHVIPIYAAKLVRLAKARPRKGTYKIEGCSALSRTPNASIRAIG